MIVRFNEPIGNGELEREVERVASTPKDALDFSYHIWTSLGADCTFYYRNVRVFDDRKKNIEENCKLFVEQMRKIDDVLNGLND